MKLTSTLTMFLGIVALMFLMYLLGELNKELFFILTVFALILLFYYKLKPGKIGFREARRITYNLIKELQDKGEIPDGDIDVMEEQRLRSLLYMDEEKSEGGRRQTTTVVEPRKWDVGVVVEGTKTRGYLVEINIYGAILGISRIRAPMLFSVRKEKDIEVIEGKVKEPEEYKKREEAEIE